MRQTARGFVEATMVAASWPANISQAALMPIEKFVDWLEGGEAFFGFLRGQLHATSAAIVKTRGPSS